jgi:hypothetical protein
MTSPVVNEDLNKRVLRTPLYGQDNHFSTQNFALGMDELRTCEPLGDYEPLGGASTESIRSKFLSREYGNCHGPFTHPKNTYTFVFDVNDVRVVQVIAWVLLCVALASHGRGQKSVFLVPSKGNCQRRAKMQ